MSFQSFATNLIQRSFCPASSFVLLFRVHADAAVNYNIDILKRRWSAYTSCPNFV